jgi:hypothetical protein
VEAGRGLVLGIVASTEASGGTSGVASSQAASSGDAAPGGEKLSDPSRTVEPARRLWRQLGFAPERLGEVVAVAPTCGLAGSSPQYARAALAAVRAAGRFLVEEPA